jgi:hypothetical protein
MKHGKAYNYNTRKKLLLLPSQRTAPIWRNNIHQARSSMTHNVEDYAHLMMYDVFWTYERTMCSDFPTFEIQKIGIGMLRCPTR